MKFSDIKSFSRIPVIYGIKNIKNSCWYIGSCIDMKSRFQKHKYYLYNNIHHSKKLQRAFNKYGENAFEIYILHNIDSIKDRFILEENYIKQYDSVHNGYNMLEKCIYVNNFTLSEKALDKFKAYIKTLEKSIIAINRFTGEIDNTFDSITSAAKYYNTSTSNISRVCKGSLNYIKDHVFVYIKDFDETKNYKVEHHCKNKKKTAEQILKMRHNKKCCKICKTDLEGNIIEQYFSISEAARQNNITTDKMRYIVNKNLILQNCLYCKIS